MIINLRLLILAAVTAFALLSCSSPKTDNLDKLTDKFLRGTDSYAIKDSLEKVKISQYVPDFDTIELTAYMRNSWMSVRVLPSGIQQCLLSESDGSNADYRIDTLDKRELYDLEKKIRSFLPVSPDTTYNPESNSQAEKSRFGILFRSHNQRKLVYDFRRGLDPHNPMRAFLYMTVPNAVISGTATTEKYRFYTKEKMRLDREIDYSK